MVVDPDTVTTYVRSWLAEAAGLEPARVDPSANFFESGLVDSLMMFRLVHDIETRFGVELDPEGLFEAMHPSAQGVAEAVVSQLTASAAGEG